MCSGSTHYPRLSLLDGRKVDKFTRKWKMSLKTFSDTWCLCMKYFKRWIRENIGKMLRRCVLTNLSARRLHYPAQPSAEIREMVLPVCNSNQNQSSCIWASLGLPIVSFMCGKVLRKYKIYLHSLSFSDTKLVLVDGSLPKGRQGSIIIHNQCYGCWWPDSARSQGPVSI